MRLSIVVRLVGILTFLSLACLIPRAGSPTISAAATPLLAADMFADEIPPPPDPAPFSDLRTVDNGFPVAKDTANAIQSANLLSQLATGVWVAQGPGPSRFGQVENISPNNEVAGALHTVLAHPTNPDILYVGGANGGLWRTVNATAASPNWVALTDYHPSLSIGALAFDHTDATWQTLVAGIGRFSSFGRTGGARTGLLRTTDGGDTWSELDGSGVLSGKNISGIAVRGSTIVVSVNTADSFTCGNIGIYRSTDGGLSFAPVTTGIPQAVAYDLIVDPNDSQILLTSIVTFNCAGSKGIYRSTDTGATWQKVSNTAVENLITNATSNLELAAGPSGAVFAAVINQGRLAGIFRTPDASTSSWVQLDTPVTNENGSLIGLNPNPNGKGGGAGDPPEMVAGGQGAIHFSMSVDPSNNNLVYVGGDRQPLEYSYPTATGAYDYSGRLFRGDASKSAGSQFVHLTHRNNVAALPGGGTANRSAPHADSRDMAIDANGNLIEVDDGGIYRRTSPQNNQGDWFSINGDIQVTEMHDVAYDAISNIIISGNQDTGTTQQISPGSTMWDSVSTADGGDVAVDTISLAAMNRSIRYSSYQGLGDFRRRVYDAGNNLISEDFPSLVPLNGGGISPQFVTPVELNAVTPSRLVIGGGSGIGESMDSGDTVMKLSPPIAVNYFAGKPLAYGGWRNGTPNPDVLYAGSNTNVYVRTAPGNSVALTAAVFPGAQPISDIVLDSDDWMTAFVSEQNQVFMTVNAGASWIEITGNLDDPDLHALDFLSGTPDILFAAGRDGVYFMLGTDPGVWEELGNNLPNAPVWDLDYDATDDVLVAGTLGRGAWTLTNLKSVLPSAQIVLKKQVVNMVGGTLTPDDFPLLLDGDPVLHSTISNVVSGTHTISEVQQAHYVLDSLNCVNDQNGPITTTANQSGGYDLDVVAGQVVTCTLTNNDFTKVTIVKDAEPASATNFRFTGAAISGGSGDSGSSIADFYLDDASPSDGDAYGSSKSFTVPRGAVYAFSEPAVSGWHLAAITCTPAGSATVNLATRSVTINTSSGSNVTCTFRNDKAAALTVRKYRESNGISGQQAPEAFLSTWTIQVKSSPTGTLVSQAATNALGKVSFSLKPGSYAVCELQKSGWTQKTPNPATDSGCHLLTLLPGTATQVDFGNCPNTSCPAMAAEVGGVDAPVAPLLFPVAVDELDGWIGQWLTTPDGPVEETIEPNADDTGLRVFLPVVVK